jgi:type VII secretion protein EccB
VRAKVDLEQPNIREALDLDEDDARLITTGLLNAIPEKEALTAPQINGIGDQPAGRAPRGLDVGSVFSVQRTGQPEEFYVVLRNGVQQIKKTTGDLIRFKDDITGGQVERLSPEDVTDSDRVRSRRDDPSFIDDSTFPEQQTEVLRPDTNPVVCLGWQTTDGGKAERTSVHVGQRVPGIPVDGDEPTWIDISTPGSSNLRIDHFYMPPGRGAVVRQATSAESFGTGSIALVSDRGVKYGVPDKATADALGLDNPLPAPDAILRLLPDGSSLDWRDVEQSYDRVPIEGGEYPSKSPDENGGSGQSGGG